MNVKLVGLAMIHKDGNVLIGQRKTKDEFVEYLTWVFPGGEFKTMNFESELKETVKEECGLDIKINSLLFARKYPDAKIPIVVFYFDCSASGGTEVAGGDLNELKWVPGTSVTKYFTTSTSDRVMEFLKHMEDNKL